MTVGPAVLTNVTLPNGTNVTGTAMAWNATCGAFSPEQASNELVFQYFAWVAIYLVFFMAFLIMLMEALHAEGDTLLGPVNTVSAVSVSKLRMAVVWLLLAFAFATVSFPLWLQYTWEGAGVFLAALILFQIFFFGWVWSFLSAQYMPAVFISGFLVCASVIVLIILFKWSVSGWAIGAWFVILAIYLVTWWGSMVRHRANPGPGLGAGGGGLI